MKSADGGRESAEESHKSAFGNKTPGQNHVHLHELLYQN
ncbi:hypothetical protein JOC33_002326 [Thalassobacillus pellis]|nr:hypothetical protein [Thalassobacillus pellis]